MSHPHRQPLTLEETEVEIAGHHFIESALFTLCGAWSTDPATASGPAGSEVQAFLATQSALHAWRAEQWAQRRPRSVGSGEEAEVRGWSAALGTARAQSGGPDRLACWVMALQPSLAARYRSQQLALAPAADAGLGRWLGMALGDVLEGGVAGGELFGRAVDGRRAGLSAKVGADTLAAILGF